MEPRSSLEFDTPKKVRAVVEELISTLSPEKIILFSRKTSLQGEISSFKLCVVVDTQDKEKVELEAYLTIDSPVPFDVLVYTPKEWEMLSQQKTSFAHHIARTGVVLYER